MRGEGPRRRPGASTGTSLAEAIVALLLGVFLVHLGFTTTARLRSAGVTMGQRLDVVAANRIARSVLRRELGRGVPWRDLVASGDSLRLRAFRGTGVVCGVGAASHDVTVSYRGDRRPEPAKDSVEVTSSDGVITHHDLVGAVAAPAPCPGADPDETGMVWTVDDTLPAGAVMGRIYESGSYHLSGSAPSMSALRYRIGSGGRQPLTPDVWSRADFVVADSAVRLELEPGGAFGSAVSEFLVWIVP